MAKTLDELVREVFGAQLLRILELEAQNGALKDQIAALVPPPSVASTSETPG